MCIGVYRATVSWCRAARRRACSVCIRVLTSCMSSRNALYFRVRQRADLSGAQWGWCTFTGLAYPRNSAPSLRFVVAALRHAQTFRGSAPGRLSGFRLAARGSTLFPPPLSETARCIGAGLRPSLCCFGSKPGWTGFT